MNETMIFEITLKNGEKWFDDSSTSYEECVFDANATFGESQILEIKQL